jgi:polyisoprenoid-binding protein YceI
MMKKLVLIALMIASMFGVDVAVDKSSKLGFEATKFAFVNVNGSFKSFDGKLTIDGGKVVAIDGTAQIASVDTAEPKRDEHLKASDWFDAGKYPTMHLVATYNGTKMIGDLTIKNITKTVSFDVISNNENGVVLQTKVNRNDFDLNGSMGFVIKNLITINLNLKTQAK